MEGANHTVSRVPFKVVLASVAGLWLAYFAIVTLSLALANYEGAVAPRACDHLAIHDRPHAHDRAGGDDGGAFAYHQNRRAPAEARGIASFPVPQERKPVSGLVALRPAEQHFETATVVGAKRSSRESVAVRSFFIIEGFFGKWICRIIATVQ